MQDYTLSRRDDLLLQFLNAPLAYPAPAYFPCPSFGVVLETENGECDLAAPLHHENTQIRLTKAERQTYCSSFSRGDLMLPEPFVVQSIAAILAPCLSRPAHTACQAVDLGGNLGVHTAYMVRRFWCPPRRLTKL